MFLHDWNLLVYSGWIDNFNGLGVCWMWALSVCLLVLCPSIKLLMNPNEVEVVDDRLCICSGQIWVGLSFFDVSSVGWWHVVIFFSIAAGGYLFEMKLGFTRESSLVLYFNSLLLRWKPITFEESLHFVKKVKVNCFFFPSGFKRLKYSTL